MTLVPIGGGGELPRADDCQPQASAQGDHHGQHHLLIRSIRGHGIDELQPLLIALARNWLADSGGHLIALLKQ